MKFETFSPCDILKPYVKYLAISEASDAATYKVLPGTALVIGIQYRGKLAVVSGEQETRLSSAGITGLMDKFRLFSNSPQTGTVLIYFKETGASAFIPASVHELFGESLSLDHFIPASTIALLEERLSENLSDRQKISIVEEFLISRMVIKPEDTMVSAALELIYRSSGTLRIRDLASQLNTSQSPLEKRFRKMVGASPKKFSSLVRLSTLLENPGKDLSLTEKGYVSGYFDQSHFIHDFKAFTGETPESFFRQKSE